MSRVNGSTSSNILYHRPVNLLNRCDSQKYDKHDQMGSQMSMPKLIDCRVGVSKETGKRNITKPLATLPGMHPWAAVRWLLPWRAATTSPSGWTERQVTKIGVGYARLNCFRHVLHRWYMRWSSMSRSWTLTHHNFGAWRGLLGAFKVSQLILRSADGITHRFCKTTLTLLRPRILRNSFPLRRGI